jgi:exodeoxyribonuclease V gamma subunit
MLVLHTSNRLEKLALSLAEILRAPIESPLEPEIIMVQSQGMARWLKLQLAQAHGICCNFRFPFPRAFSYDAFRSTLPDLPAESAYDADELVWRIMKDLPPLLHEPGFEALSNYFSGAADGRKRFQLAAQIAFLFDQYLVFRPELILDWERGRGGHWQAVLWREISAPFREAHPAALRTKFFHQLTLPDSVFPKLPTRVSIFGVSALPPFYLDILAGLAKGVEVHFYLLEPCREFWGYIRSELEQEKMLRMAGRGASEAEALHLEKGNRLLASMGKLGRDFLVQAQAAGDWQESDLPLFEDPGEGTLLACIQSDCLCLRDRGRGDALRTMILPEDDSVQLHSCHSPVRELEVLNDHLLSWFERDPTLTPRDILVMIPDIETYAPFIQGIFDSPETEELRIPFSLADRTARAQSQLIETFLSVLNLAGSRLGPSQVLGLLDAESLREKFDLHESDLETIRHWIEAVQIRWGKDIEQRTGLGLPGWSENSWRHGLQRLLLGYAMGGNGENLFQGILPHDDVEGEAVDLLGRFVEFIERLFSALDALNKPRCLENWAALFQSLLEDFFTSGEREASGWQVLIACFEKLRRAGARAGFAEELGLEVVLEQLNRQLALDHFGAGYLTGGVTFCTLKPMRSIPARIICLLGMNDGAFPRSSPQLSFDLMAEQPKLGDRSSREDDRYLFLETLISAREKLYISYAGQSIKDNSQAPPSVLVSELLDYISQGFELPGKQPIQAHIETRHRLQAFSAAYFKTGRLFSYSSENLQASLAARLERDLPAPFFPTQLPEPGIEWRQITLRLLTEFLCHPARFLAVRRLGLELLPKSGALDEREPFELDGLSRYAIEQELLDFKLKGRDLAATAELVRASGRLPASASGSAQHARVCREIAEFHKKLQSYLPEKFGQPLPFKIEIGQFTVSGQFSRIAGNGLLFYRPATIKSPDLVRAWIEHLLWNAGHPPGAASESIVLGKGSVRTMRPVDRGEALLGELLDLYWTGLRQPVKFFPRTSFAFAEADYKLMTGTAGRSKKQPLAFAEEAWFGPDFGREGECADQYFSMFFGNGQPLDEEFEKAARTVFHPLLQNSSEAEL